LTQLKKLPDILDINQVRIFLVFFNKSNRMQIFKFFLIETQTALKNAFGKQQNSIDLAADQIIFKNLEASGVVYAAASEENPEVRTIQILELTKNLYR
jgi:fructose-1,6-bisphosphatase